MAELDQARFEQALHQLERYRAEFRHGALDAEARVLQVVALCGLGRVDEARQLAAGLNEATNPAVRRLRGSCVFGAATESAPAGH